MVRGVWYVVYDMSWIKRDVFISVCLMDYCDCQQCTGSDNEMAGGEPYDGCQPHITICLSADQHNIMMDASVILFNAKCDCLNGRFRTMTQCWIHVMD